MLKSFWHRSYLIALVCSVFGMSTIQADTLTLAVAANFSAPMEQIATEFEATTGHHLAISVGSTGRFYAQIRHGAPYDVLLSADAQTPKKLVDEGLALSDSLQTYAIGRLVLYSNNPNLVDSQGDVIKTGHFSKIALADPKLSPYGKAALQTLDALGMTQTLRSKFVFGESIGQTWQFVATGNAPLGFVAGAQISHPDQKARGSYWVVPGHLHEPLRQDMVILNRAKDKKAAREFLAWMSGPEAWRIMTGFGYGIVSEHRPQKP